MKKFIFLLFGFALSVSVLAQSGSCPCSVIKSLNVNDSTTVIIPSNGGALYYNRQSNKWRISQNGSVYDLVNTGSGSASLTSTQIGFGSGTNTLTGDAKFTWDNTNENLIQTGGTSSVAGGTKNNSFMFIDGSTLSTSFQWSAAFGGRRAAPVSYGGSICPRSA